MTTTAEGLSPELVRHIEASSKRIYRLLSISGYGRLDYGVHALAQVM